MELDFRQDPTILSAVIDAMADGVFTVDRDGLFVAWSQGAERITGYQAAEVVGRPCHMLEGPNCKGFGRLAELLSSSEDAPEGLCQQECKFVAKDGREIYILGSLRVVRDESGEIAGAVGSFTDLTSFIKANERITLLEEQARSRGSFELMIGKSEPMQEVFRRLRLAAQSDVTVFLTGESGTGKELAARAIHNQSDRRERPFVAVNCSAIPETLLESELFGHIRGAFTGAVRDKTGLFQAASGGTLFLDEIGDITPLLQLKLLRVIQERQIQRVGDERPVHVDVRIVTATNRDLKLLIESGRFREDFYYRIHVFEIQLPPLRERREDIPALVDGFISDFSRSLGKPVKGIARDAMQRLLDFDWPGNIRQLRNAIEHAFVTVSGQTITLFDLPHEIRDAGQQATGRRQPLLDPRQAAEREQIIRALERTGGNRTEASKLLGFSRVTLWKKMNKYAIELDS